LTALWATVCKTVRSMLSDRCLSTPTWHGVQTLRTTPLFPGFRRYVP